MSKNHEAGTKARHLLRNIARASELPENEVIVKAAQVARLFLQFSSTLNFFYLIGNMQLVLMGEKVGS
jgi:hypothetical protein